MKFKYKFMLSLTTLSFEAVKYTIFAAITAGLFWLFRYDIPWETIIPFFVGCTVVGHEYKYKEMSEKFKTEVERNGLSHEIC